MPELPEVEVIVRGLNKNIQGLTISNIVIKSEGIVRGINPEGIHWFHGRRIDSIIRHGKFIEFRFDHRSRMLMHLCMTGQLLVLPPDAEIPKHSHVIFQFVENSNQLVFNDTRRFGKIMFSVERDELVEAKIAGLGADPLEMSLEGFCRIVASRKMMIKPLLLNQSTIAGLGNIYVDESLFDAGIHPMRLSNEIPEEKVVGLYKSIRNILNAAIEAGGSTIDTYRRTDGSRGNFQVQHRIYGKYGEECPECGESIHRLTVGGRTSSVCNNCQEPPPPKQNAKVFRDCWWGN